MSSPASPAVTAATANTPVHTQPVRMSRPIGARGLVPLAYSLRPTGVRARTTDTRTRTTPHRTTTGGTGIPNVVPRTGGPSGSTTGGGPTMFDFVRTSTALISIEYMPSVTTRDWTAK